MNKLNNKESKTTHIFMNDKHLSEIPKEIESDAVILYFHNNIIRKIENLNGLHNITHLYLQWNKINRIENLSDLKCLKKLYLGNNYISVVEKLDGLNNLIELHIERQILDFGETLCFEPRCIKALSSHLRILNISDNRLTHFNELSSLNHLSNLIARNNRFEDYNVIASNLKTLLYLRDVDFSGNPMCKKHRYKEKIIAACKRLENIDGKIIPDKIRQFIKCFEMRQNDIRCKMHVNHRNKKALRKIETSDKCNNSSNSPDAQLAFLESQRLASLQARQNRQKLLAMSNGSIPRCFWRNKHGSRVKINDANAPFGDFLKNTPAEWP